MLHYLRRDGSSASAVQWKISRRSRLAPRKGKQINSYESRRGDIHTAQNTRKQNKKIDWGIKSSVAITMTSRATSPTSSVRSPYRADEILQLDSSSYDSDRFFAFLAFPARRSLFPKLLNLSRVSRFTFISRKPRNFFSRFYYQVESLDRSIEISLRSCLKRDICIMCSSCSYLVVPIAKILSQEHCSCFFSR